MDANIAIDPDTEVWKRWNKSRSSQDLSALFKQMENLIQKKVNIFSAAPVPRSALEGEAKKWAYKAFETYDPNRGVKLSTHVTNWLQKMYRYTTQHQNFARIPEHVALKINAYKSAQSELQEKFGRPPTHIELADHLKWSQKHVAQVDNSLRQDIASTAWEGDEHFDQNNPRLEILAMGYYSLTPEEQLIYDYTLGQHGKVKSNPGQIAKIMKMSPSKVSKLRNSVSTKLQVDLENT